MKKRIVVIFLIALCSIVLTGCFLVNGFINAHDNHFVYNMFTPAGNIVVHESPKIGTVLREDTRDTVSFRLKNIDTRLEGVDCIQFDGVEGYATHKDSEELNDLRYYRVIWRNYSLQEDREEYKYNKYYIPNMPIYWYFMDITITSGNTSFGDDYPPGSDLTPLFEFTFPSLKEFIDNRYKGDYTQLHHIQANDKKAWQNLVLFENIGKLSIEKLPTKVEDGGKPTVTIAFHFLLKNMELRGTPKSELRPKITLQLEIE